MGALRGGLGTAVKGWGLEARQGGLEPSADSKGSGLLGEDWEVRGQVLGGAGL